MANPKSYRLNEKEMELLEKKAEEIGVNSTQVMKILINKFLPLLKITIDDAEKKMVEGIKILQGRNQEGNHES